MLITRRYYTKDNKQKQLMLLLDGKDVESSPLNIYGSAATRTECFSKLPRELEGIFDMDKADRDLKDFMERYKNLYETPREKLYSSYDIPKKTGGVRRIDEPCGELQNALSELKYILKKDFFMMYHTCAFAYVENRSAMDSLKKHQHSNWFMKTDFHHFFNETSKQTLEKSLSYQYPYKLYMETQERHDLLMQALDLAFLNNGLPQGTVLSPDLTNLVMIPFDWELSRRMARNNIIYTRYADDCLFSKDNSFDKQFVLNNIYSILHKFGFRYKLNKKKTRYGSVKGKNFNLGLMLNGQHNITVGHEAKRYYKAKLYKMLLRELHDRGEAESFLGLTSYYLSIEPKYFTHLIIQKSYKTRRYIWHDKPNMLMRELSSKVRQYSI